jgi:hypothetical protein
VSAAMKSERDWLLYLSGGNLRTGKPEIGASCALSASITTVTEYAHSGRESSTVYHVLSAVDRNGVYPLKVCVSLRIF